MAGGGEAGLALGYATYGSFVGGLSSVDYSSYIYTSVSAIALKSSNADVA